MLRLINKYDSCKLYKQHVGRRISKFKTSSISTFRQKSHYHALELNSAASPKDIKAAYYKLSLLYHPDKNDGSEESVAKFREITEAYEVLSNPDRKKEYDEGYNFQPQYSQKYRGTENSVKSSSYEGPHSGKTKDFDYDEHFKKHYQDSQKQRDAEFEYFKRRWEAEFYRRYPTAEHYYRNRHKHTEYMDSDILKKRLRERRIQLFGILGIWGFLVVMTVFTEWLNPEKRYSSPIYYSVNSKNECESENFTENKPKGDL